MKPLPQAKPRLTLVISSLGGGGAERVMCSLAKLWNAAGNQVTLITLSDPASDAYSLDPGIARLSLNSIKESRFAAAAIANNWRRVATLRDAIRRSDPDVVVSFMDRMNVLTLLAARRLRVPVIVSERVDPRTVSIGRGWNALRRVSYRLAACLVVQTPGIVEWARGLLPASRVAVIPNPLSADVLAVPVRACEPDAGAMHVVGVGRLSPQKGFDLLIRAFAHCDTGDGPWHLTIMGDGPERGRLEQLARDLGVAERVRLAGHQRNPFAELTAAHIFVLSSRFEGFPNVLTEAMACGLPVISFACPSGPADIVTDGEDGILVEPENDAALAGALARLMADPALRHRLGTAALKVRDRFAPGIVLDQWNQVIQRTIADRGDSL
jgi:glycosyltransferase involved in cell wall biosynthesis